MNIQQILSDDRKLINDQLDKIFNSFYSPYAELKEAMKYAVLSGGKRVRGILAFETARLLSGDLESALVYSCALEIMHASSLVHDDMPEMDNDDMRRGIESCHKKYGQTMGLLCGDALICLPFQLIAEKNPVGAIDAVKILADSSGYNGIIAGQCLDISLSKIKHPLYKDIEFVHRFKTGRLFRCAGALGAIAASGTDDDLNRCSEYAMNIGVAFQIVDDILDHDYDDSNSVLNFMSKTEAEKYALSFTDKARSYIKDYNGSDFLQSYAKSLISRSY